VQEPIRVGPRPLLERRPPTPQDREVCHLASFETVDRSGSLVSIPLSKG
jgi:hypothetical protein